MPCRDVVMAELSSGWRKPWRAGKAVTKFGPMWLLTRLGSTNDAAIHVISRRRQKSEVFRCSKRCCDSTHIQHVKVGGSDSVDNCVIICQSCHYSAHEGG